MNATPLLLFPDALVSARQRRALSQRHLAVEMQMDPSHVCALEKGRKGAVTPALLERLAKALGLSAEERAGLEWAAIHDQVVLCARDHAGEDAARMVSLGLQAQRALSTEEQQGVRALLFQLVSAKRALTSLAGGHSMSP